MTSDVNFTIGNSSMSETVFKSDDERDASLACKVVKLMIAFIVTVLIIFNNLVNLLVLPKMIDIGKRMKILLYSLSISDICLGVAVCLPALPSGALEYWPFSAAVCQMSGVMTGVAIGVSLWSLTAISIERYILVRKPIRSNKNKGTLFVMICVAGIWLFSIMFFALPIFQDEDLNYYVYDNDVISCSFRWRKTEHFLVAKFFYPVLSASIIFYTNIKINAAIQEAQRKRRKWMVNSRPQLHGECSTENSDVRKAIKRELRNPKHDLNKEDGIGVHGSNLVENGVQATPLRPEDKFIVKSTSMTNGHNQQSPEPLVITRSMINRTLRARLLLIITSCLFFSLISPYMLTSLIDHFLVDYEIPAAVKFASLWMLNTNSFVNVYVYSFIYKDFRFHCMKLLNTIVCRQTVEVFMSNSTRKTSPQRSRTNRSQEKSNNELSKHVQYSRGNTASEPILAGNDQDTIPRHGVALVPLMARNDLLRPPILLPRDDAFQSHAPMSRDQIKTSISIIEDNKQARLLMPYSQTPGSITILDLPEVEV